MKVKFFLLLLLIILGGGFFLLKETSLLSIENMDRSRSIYIKIAPKDKFSIFYIHSIYQEPVIEEFMVEKDFIILIGVKTKSPAVMEYYGFEDTKEFQKMNVRLGGFFIIKRASGEGQGLIVKDKKIYLSELGEKGDRILIRLKQISLGRYIFSKFFQKLL